MKLTDQAGFNRMFSEFKSTAGDIQGSKAKRCAVSADRGDKIVTASVQQGFFGQRARGHDTHDLSFNRPYAGRGIAYLLADGNRDTPLNKFGEIGIHSMKGNTAHWDGFACRRASGGERYTERIGCLSCIREKQLIKVTHAIEQKFIRVLGLNGQVLTHHRCMVLFCTAHL